MDYILPIILWLKVGEHKHSWYVKAINWAIVIVYSAFAVMGAIGSVQVMNFPHTWAMQYVHPSQT